jgi:hypothetical protein
MFRTALEDRPTHWVVRHMLQANDRAEARLHATWLNPWIRITRSWRESYEESGRGYLKELSYRFGGVINLYLRSQGITVDADLVRARGEIMQRFFVESYELKEAELFAPLLWRSIRVTGGASSNAALKRRFMLRQFVEDVPKGIGRDMLRRLGFERQPGAPPVNAKDLTAVRGVYPRLHTALLKQGVLLDVMTASAIPSVQVAAFEPPYGQYDEWLFK